MRALVTLLALLAGCSPRLAGSHYYACEAPSDCPPHVPHCTVEGLCAVPERDASMPPRDGGVPRDAASAPQYARCGSGLPPCAATDTCLGAAPGSAGRCSPPCATNDDCGAGLCVAALCRAPCVGADCGTHECLSATAGAERANVCLDGAFAVAAPHFMACSGPCAAPFRCIGGACLRDCGAGGLCRASEICVAAPGDARACLPLCSGACEGGAACVVTPDETRATCVPGAWPPI